MFYVRIQEYTIIKSLISEINDTPKLCIKTFLSNIPSKLSYNKIQSSFSIYIFEIFSIQCLCYVRIQEYTKMIITCQHEINDTPRIKTFESSIPSKLSFSLWLQNDKFTVQNFLTNLQLSNTF